MCWPGVLLGLSTMWVSLLSTVCVIAPVCGRYVTYAPADTWYGQARLTVFEAQAMPVNTTDSTWPDLRRVDP
jgi:hypothetical protein